MKNSPMIIAIAVLLTACVNHHPAKETMTANDSIKQSEEAFAAVDTTTGEEWEDLRQNLTVISSNIPGNNAANVIHNAVKDVDGNSYDAVRIGEQVWMQTDLRTKHYRDGSDVKKPPLPHTMENNYDYSNTQPYYVEGYSTECNATDEVLLYNWPAVADSRGLCPDDWHVATKQDWDALETFLGADSAYVQGRNPKNIAKALGSTQWPDWVEYEEYSAIKEYTVGYKPASTNNATGFSAYPWPYYDGRHYGGMGFAAYWTPNAISKSKAWSIKIYGNGATLYKKPDEKGYYYMVRCVKGER